MNRKEIIKAEKELEDKLQEVYHLAGKIAVALVKETMRKNKSLIAFYMAMGSYHFEDKDGNHIYGDDKPSFEKFNDFMNKYCVDLGIWGEDITITRNDL